MPKSNDLRSFSFVLAVPDLDRSAAYFRDALGFRLEWPAGSGWQLASRGGVRIMMGDHSYFGYLHADDVDAPPDEFVRRGALVLQPPADKPHGMREFAVATSDGHRMMVGQDAATSE